jgi:hypothetical protein
MSLVLNTGTAEKPSLVSSPTFVLGAAGWAGDNITWSLSADGTLTFDGTGEMWDFESGKSPWWDHRLSIETVVIPDGVTSIGQYAFYDCDNLTEITIPDGVKTIGEAAFSDCVGLTKVTIGDGVTTIGVGAFGYCGALKAITIPDGVTTIESHAFYDCRALANATLGAGVTTIGDEAFYGCTALANVTCLAAAPPPLGTRNFGKDTAYVLHVPAASIFYYKAEAAWNGVFVSIEAIQ